MRHNVTNGVSESLALSQNAQMASNPHTSRLSASELQAAQLRHEFSLAQSRHCRVITKMDKLHLFFILASFKHFSTCALSWRQCTHTHSKRTHNARFSLSHTHTHTHTHFALRMQTAVSIFSAPMLTDQCVHTAHCCVPTVRSRSSMRVSSVALVYVY